MNLIDINNLHKKYDSLTAVDGVSFSLKKGEMFGLVGPDGAGKTTIIRILCGLLNFDEGEVSLFESSIKLNKTFIQKRIGYLSQKFSLYGDLSIDENLEFFAEIHNIVDYKSRRDELLNFTRLIKFRDRHADKLSGGMKQKLALSAALIHNPEILFLDEPTTGVDPVSRRDFWRILSALQKEGLTVLMTTPYLDEAERCGRVALMDKGKIIALDTPENLKKSINMEVLEIVCDPVKTAYRLIKEIGVEAQMFGDRINILYTDSKVNKENLIKHLTDNKITLTDTRITTPTLENIFIHLINNKPV